MRWVPTANEKAADETAAHTGMFTPRDNPGFYSLGEKAKGIVVRWVDRGWYGSSEPKEGQQSVPIGDGWVTPDLEEEKRDHTGIGRDWQGVDGQQEDDVRMREEEEELEDSVIVERARNGEVPLPVSPVEEKKGMHVHMS